MKKLNTNGMKWVKFAHILCALSWPISRLCLTVLLHIEPSTPQEQVYINEMIQFMTEKVLIPSVIGILLTGFIYSTFTRWGWFTYKWVMVKWVGTIGMAIWGAFVAGGIQDTMLKMVTADTIGSFQSSEYMALAQKHLLFAYIQTGVLVVLIWISIFKPWGKRKK